MIAIIAAVARNGVIGNRGKIPWDIPEDRAHFRKLTTGHVIVMGRRTYEEIGHPLPDRFTYLVSSTRSVHTPDCCTVSSLSDVLAREKKRDIFICGGRMLYEEALPFCDTLFLTELPFDCEGDAVFPDWDKDRFTAAGIREQETKSGIVRFCKYRVRI